jgi:hypothetical protein
MKYFIDLAVASKSNVLSVFWAILGFTRTSSPSVVATGWEGRKFRTLINVARPKEDNCWNAGNVFCIIESWASTVTVEAGIATICPFVVSNFITLSGDPFTVGTCATVIVVSPQKAPEGVNITGTYPLSVPSLKNSLISPQCWTDTLGFAGFEGFP